MTDFEELARAKKFLRYVRNELRDLRRAVRILETRTRNEIRRLDNYLEDHRE
jgi:hypothetical protein